MKNKEEIVELLIRELNSVYCDTCNGENCEDCYRKYMNWGIKEGFAEALAKEILGE